MSDNRPAPTETRHPRGMMLSDYYNGLFKFIIGFIEPILPDAFKADPIISTLLTSLPVYCNDQKKFLMLHYGVVYKLCSEENGIRSIRNLIEILDDNEESKAKLNGTGREAKQVATAIIRVCEKVLATPDEEIVENVEKFCLYVDILTKQFMPPKSK